MATTRRLKQALMGIGLLTVLAAGAFVALMAYIWWDSRSSADEDFTVDSEFDEGGTSADTGSSDDGSDGVDDLTTDSDAEVSAD